MALTFCIAAATYGVLAMHRLLFTETLLVELATALANRVLPAGLGGLGLNGVYLYRRKHSAAEATAVVSVNNLIGMCAHLLLLFSVLAFQPTVVRTLFDHYHVPWTGGLVAVVLLLSSYLVPWVRGRLSRFTGNLVKSLRKESVDKLLGAFVLAVLLTSAYTLMLLIASRAVGVKLDIVQVFIIFSVGMFVSTATPTPGGLVGAEAGLFTGFVAYGVPNTEAAAAIMLYRLVTYWLPLIPGILSLVSARDRKLV